MIFKCKICGGELKANGDEKYVICEYCGTKQEINGQCSETNINKSEEKNSRFGKLLIFLFSASLIIIGICIVLSLNRIGNIFDKSENNPEHTAVSLPEVTPEIDNTPLPEDEAVTAAPAPSEYTYVENVEAMVKQIRGKYYSTQNHLDTLEKTNDGKYTIYRNSGGSAERVDFKINNTNVCFYYDNGELYFVFAFENKKENRFYFYNNCIFRWIDESAAVHDNEQNNPELENWQRVILDEAAQLKDTV